ncbi:malto-oligosyltrehalose trehalohydrolase [soil metagenome]
MPGSLERRLAGGVEATTDGAHARVWAPRCHSVDFALQRDTGQSIHSMQDEGDGFFSGRVPAVAGDRYWFRLNGADLRPDPHSRFQPDGPHGPSQIIDPAAHAWGDQQWQGPPAGKVIYEMHVGTFTPQGTWAAAARELPELASLGITVVEMMPVAEFPGRFGWGYDGVNLYAPTRLYGNPDGLRRFVDAAHTAGVAVILDVVYNHLGPDGNYLADYSADYFTDKYTNDWGRALNFEGPAPARSFFVENAGYWIDEFHFDGLRLDATQDIHDASAEHVLGSIIGRARAAAGTRRIYVIAENESQNTQLVRPPSEGGFGIDGMWNDDYHHSAHVALTGRREAYYTDYRGSIQELISAAKYGFLYQGQWYRWQKQRRGTPGLDLPPSTFISFLQNHDQIANSAFGRRLHELSSPGRYRALVALMFLGPGTPLIFQGQEFSASTPFLYFADHNPELVEPIRAGRRKFLAQFPTLRDPQVVALFFPPDAEDTYRRCILDLSEREAHHEAYALYKDLIALRRSQPGLDADSRRADGAVISPEALLLRFFGDTGEADRLLIVNLGCDLDLSPIPEPLAAPPHGSHWNLEWSSEAVRYGGQGTPEVRSNSIWHVPGECAVLLSSQPGVAKDDDDGSNSKD